MDLAGGLRGLRPIRNVDAGALLETFLVCGVAAILGIRLYLELTGYPQVGGDGLHIAHMLWGGLLMLIAIVLLVAFLGKGIVRLAAVLGGLGFGIFIDELGKFVTSDNNYFFRPTFALIYLIFMILFLSFRAIDRRRGLSAEEALVNAVDLLKEAVRHDLDDREKEQALDLLRRSDQRSPVVGALRRLLEETVALPNRAPALPVRLARRAHALYVRVVRLSWFPTALIVLFALIGLADLLSVASAIAADPDFRSGDPDLSFVDWGDLLSSAAVGALIGIGIVRLRLSRLAAYLWFRRGMLVSVFFSQIFYFYAEQLPAVIGLGVTLLLLAALNYTIGEEEAGAADLPSGEAPAPATLGMQRG
jgi:hypothetical protein